MASASIAFTSLRGLILLRLQQPVPENTLTSNRKAHNHKSLTKRQGSCGAAPDQSGTGAAHDLERRVGRTQRRSGVSHSARSARRIRSGGAFCMTEKRLLCSATSHTTCLGIQRSDREHDLIPDESFHRASLATRLRLFSVAERLRIFIKHRAGGVSSNDCPLSPLICIFP